MVSDKRSSLACMHDYKSLYITGWAVALTCYISHSAKHRKWQILTGPQGAKTPEPILMKLGIVDYVQDPTRHDNFGGVAQRGRSGQICDLSHL